MAHQIIIKKRFENRLNEILVYLEKDWNKKVANQFLEKLYLRIDEIRFHPYIGALTGVGDTRSISITKHNRLFYRVAGNKVFIVTIYDTRRKNYPPKA
ncbi:MAG: type II toxin-antitoxin system RelE/ParE family toxin [Bacteroidota bacterium]